MLLCTLLSADRPVVVITCKQVVLTDIMICKKGKVDKEVHTKWQSFRILGQQGIHNSALWQSLQEKDAI